MIKDLKTKKEKVNIKRNVKQNKTIKKQKTVPPTSFKLAPPENHFKRVATLPRWAVM